MSPYPCLVSKNITCNIMQSVKNKTPEVFFTTCKCQLKVLHNMLLCFTAANLITCSCKLNRCVLKFKGRKQDQMNDKVTVVCLWNATPDTALSKHQKKEDKWWLHIPLLKTNTYRQYFWLNDQSFGKSFLDVPGQIIRIHQLLASFPKLPRLP